MPYLALCICCLVSKICPLLSSLFGWYTVHVSAYFKTFAMDEQSTACLVFFYFLAKFKAKYGCWTFWWFFYVHIGQFLALWSEFRSAPKTFVTIWSIDYEKNISFCIPRVAALQGAFGNHPVSGGSLDLHHFILIWDTGTSFGLTPFQSDFINYAECDIPVWDVTKVNKVIGIGTTIHKLPMLMVNLNSSLAFHTTFYRQTFVSFPLRRTIKCMVGTQRFMVKAFRWSFIPPHLATSYGIITIWVDYQITSPHHLCIFICRYQKLYYYCTLTSALTLNFLTIWPPICLFFIKSRTWWYVTAYLHVLIQLYYSFTSSCSVLHRYITGPLCKFRIFLHLMFSCKVFVIWAVFQICWYFSNTSHIHPNFLLVFPVPLPKPHKYVNL